MTTKQVSRSPLPHRLLAAVRLAAACAPVRFASPSRPLPILALAALGVLASVRLVAAQCPDGTPPPCARAAARPAAPAANSVAVLPFETLSRDSADAILAEGFTEELNTRLGRIASLAVMSRGVVRRYRSQAQDPTEVGRALRVAFVVSGSLRRSGDRVRVTAELARSRDGTQAWADAFDRASGDLMTIEADLAQAVAVAIAGRLLPRDQAALASRPTRDPAAWNAYLRGNALIARRMTGGLPGAIAAYEEAIRLDPDFAAAWGRLSEGLSLGAAGYLGFERDTVRLRQRAYDAATRALALDSMSAEGWIARGLVLGDQGRQSESIAAFAHAVMLDSNLAEAHYHLGGSLQSYSEDRTSAERHLRQAHALDPTLANAVEWYVVLLWKDGRPFEGLAWLDTLGALAPALSRATRTADLRIMDFTLDLLLRTGDTAQARAGLTGFLAASRGTDTAGVQALAARVWEGLGDTVQARAALHRAEASSDAAPSLQIAALVAAAQVALGERERALALLEGRRRDGANLWEMMRRPYFESLRREPRFARLLQEVRPR